MTATSPTTDAVLDLPIDIDATSPESGETPVIAGDETIDPDETPPLAVPLRDEVLSAVVRRRADSPRQDGMTEIEILEIIGIEVACDLRGEALIQGYSHQPSSSTPTQSP